mmetsp:Transcript_2576/g.9846  ORF Transcript_2576/g.9846 Transcript_2576/m.9846 type:complete len:129 (-) Transcript_2576:3318-3704(-)
MKKRNNRSSLFAMPPNASDMANQTQQQQYDQVSSDHLDSQVDSKLNQMRSAMKDVKHVAITIGDELRRSTKELDEMDDIMNRTTDRVKGVRRRLRRVIEQGGAKYMCWLILFVVFVFVVLYWMVRRSL